MRTNQFRLISGDGEAVMEMIVAAPSRVGLCRWLRQGAPHSWVRVVVAVVRGTGKMLGRSVISIHLCLPFYKPTVQWVSVRFKNIPWQLYIPKFRQLGYFDSSYKPGGDSNFVILARFYTHCFPVSYHVACENCVSVLWYMLVIWSY